MSNMWLNIRFGNYHLQWSTCDWLPRILLNTYWIGKKKKLIKVYIFLEYYSYSED
jgi:hypothetical protein